MLLVRLRRLRAIYVISAISPNSQPPRNVLRGKWTKDGSCLGSGRDLVGRRTQAAAVQT